MQIIRKPLAALTLLLVFSSAAAAVDLSGNSQTYLFSRQTLDQTRLTPLYEYLDFRAQDLGAKNVSFNFGGWYRYDLQNESYGTKDTGDLQYAYVGYRGDSANAFVNLGRVVVTQGATPPEPVDGMAAGTDLLGGFSVSAFGGVPVLTTFDSRTGDSIYGGRISQGLPNLYRIGASYLLERNNSVEIRKEEGLDLWFRPFDRVELNGTSLYNALTYSFARHAYYLTIGPLSILTLRTEFTEVDYRDFFTAPTTSAFQFQPAFNLYDKLKSLGEEASLAFWKVVLSGDYKKYNYVFAGDASYYGGKLTIAPIQNTGIGFSLHKMNGETDALRYSEYRAYGFTRFGQADLALDLVEVAYDVEINGVKKADSAVLAGGYALTPKTKISADVEYAKNPYYNKDVRGLLKLVYTFDFAPAATRRK